MATYSESAPGLAALTYAELLNHNDEETGRWRAWFSAHPEMLDAKLELAMMHDVRGVLFHIFLVELRYGDRLQERPEVPAESLARNTVDELFAIGETARSKFREFMAGATEADWNKKISFKTLSVGEMSASKRKCFVHALMHSMRHWAQLATALRQQGTKADWHHDFMFSKAME